MGDVADMFKRYDMARVWKKVLLESEVKKVNWYTGVFNDALKKEDVELGLHVETFLLGGYIHLPIDGRRNRVRNQTLEGILTDWNRFH